MSDDRAEKFVSTPPYTPPCWICVHKHASGPTCAAFPRGIPHEIETGRNQHLDPYPGDWGIRYAPIRPLS